MLSQAPMTRKQWIEEFQAELLKIESEFKDKEIKTEERDLLNDMKKICSNLLEAQNAAPGFLGAPTTKTMGLVNEAKTLGLKYFVNDELGLVPTGPLAVRVVAAYGDYAGKWDRVSDKPFGSALLAPDYTKRSGSCREYQKDPQAYVAAVRAKSTPTPVKTAVAF